ncbi:SDR family NAD(P)-dependent oxidoreductase [Candidatus Kaiserbacteria bacterium]|nr:SDR family NAD(P)-dependent oxidoreductase [Candidatus Kaiserbacteria bacterium]
MKSGHLRGKSILVTGGTGTFGKALVRRLCTVPGITRIIVLSRDEYKQDQMRREFDDPRLRFLIGDVRDPKRLHRAFNHVDIVIHAAALKQVPALEYNPVEAVETNIIGTRNVIEAAFDCGVDKVLFISTDKAVQPINLYGATKMCAERLAIAANSYRGRHSRTRISVMRYGNVLGSRGSIVELIEKQRPSGTVTLTDERMTRFWIHIESVVDCVINALRLMESGEIFVPSIRSSRVVDLIKVVAPRSPLKIIGIRPGEKLHETLISEHEALHTKLVEDLFVVEPEFADWGRKSPFAKFRSVPKGFSYMSNDADRLIPRERIKKELRII